MPSIHPSSRFVHDTTLGIMETTGIVPKDTAPHLENPPECLRVLVQTKTHHVPGDDYHERLLFMLDLICQHHWNRDYDPDQDRWSVYGARFGYDNRPCYFLVDHGQCLTNEDVPVLWYQWTGESLEALPQALPPEIRIKLREYPFTGPPIQDTPKKAPLNAATRRQSIRSKLHAEMSLSSSDFEFLKEHPEEAKWLKDHIEPRFWLKYESLANLRKD